MASVEQEHAPTKGTRSFGLGTLMLFVAVVAVGTAYLHAQRKNKELRNFVRQRKTMLGEVSSLDNSSLAVAEEPTPLSNECRWNLFVPATKHELCFATKTVGKSNFPQPSHRIPIESGTHHLYVRAVEDESDWLVIASVDEDEAISDIALPRAKDRQGKLVRSLQLKKIGTSQTRRTDSSRLQVFRQIFYNSSIGVDKAAKRGLLIWIEAK